MVKDNNWLREQRASGGTSFTSSMLRMTAETTAYVEHITKVVGEQRGLSLSVKESIYGYEVILDTHIVWFGRDIDVELLRASNSAAYEDYLHQRLDRLEDLKIIS